MSGTLREKSQNTAEQRGIIWILGERGWTRTIDPCLKRALLCQLSYAPTPCNQAIAVIFGMREKRGSRTLR